MLSKAQIKHIRSLTQQKYRKEHNVFIAEGDKIVREWLASGASIKMIIALESWLSQHTSLISAHPEAAVHQVEQHVLESVSTLQTPNQVLIVAAIPASLQTLPTDEWTIVLENIQDPGNMGTIIRIADWFGIKHIVCSEDCVDVYNPKVVQAAMGGHLRIHFHTTSLINYISSLTIPTLAATLHGDNLYSLPPLEKAVLMVGNESKGLSEALINAASQKVTIPKKGGAESLNAAVATGILCAHFIR